MPSAMEGRYKAYELLKELDSQIAATMSQVAYGRMSRIEWVRTCKAHRIAFEEWIRFADLQAGEEKRRTPEGPGDM